MQTLYRFLFVIVILLGLGNAPAMAQEVPDFSTMELNIQAVEWVAPSGTISTIGNPIYQWKPVEGASFYQIYVGKDNAPFYVPTKFFGRVDSTSCTADLCSIDLTSQRNLDPFGTAWLNNDSYAVFIRPDTTEDWAGPFAFTVQSEAPTVPTALTGTTTGFTWALDAGASRAAFFQIYIAPSDALGIPVQPITWVSRQDACGSWDGTNCTFNTNNPLNQTTTYNVYLHSWGAGGFSTGGNIPGADGWYECKFIPQDGPCLLAPTEPGNLNAVVNENNVATFSWTPGENADQYILWVGTISETEVGTVYFSNEPLAASDVCAESNTTGTCSFTLTEPLNRGVYSWFLLAKGPGGVPANALSGYVAGQPFTVTNN